MTARVSQAPIAVLAEKTAHARVNQVGIAVLWAIGATARVNQVAVTILGRPPVRRIIGITD